MSIDGRSKLTFPNRATIRLDFPARGGMPAVKVFYHDSARTTDPEVYRVPGMENETILPPTEQSCGQGSANGHAGIQRRRRRGRRT